MLRFTWRRTLAWGFIATVIIGAWLFASSLNPDAKREAPTEGSSSPIAIEPAVLVDTPPASDGRPLDVGPRQGQLAPNFEASDLSGRRFQLSEYRGHPTLVNFWASWCIACKKELPAIQAVAKEHEVRGLRVLAVNMGDDPEAARRSLEARGVSALAVALDLKAKVADAYGVRGLPVTFFVDPDGVIRRVRFGEMSQDMVSRFTLELLGASPPVAEAAPTSAPPAPGHAAEQATVKITLEMFGSGTLLLQSPSLRCGASFCAGFLLQALRDMQGVRDATSRVINEQTGDWGFAITYDPARVTPQDVIAVYERSLTEKPDPLYPLPHRVEIVDASRG